MGWGRESATFQSAFCLCLPNGLELCNNILPRGSNYQSKHFDPPAPNIFTRENCDYSLLHTIFKFHGILWSSNLHWGYSIIKIVGQWCCNGNCVMFFYQIDCGGWHLEWEVCPLVGISKKGYATTFMTLFIDFIYQNISSI